MHPRGKKIGLPPFRYRNGGLPGCAAPCFSVGSLWVPVCKASARASEGSQRGLSWR